MKRILALSLLSLSTLGFADYAINSITCKVGDSNVIQFASNPTTGYMWELKRLTQENIINFEELPFEPNNEDSVGSDGYQPWKITAVNKGKAHATFDLKRSWTSDVINTVTFNFIVE